MGVGRKAGNSTQRAAGESIIIAICDICKKEVWDFKKVNVFFVGEKPGQCQESALTTSSMVWHLKDTFL